MDEVSCGGRGVKVTLVWTDPPSTTVSRGLPQVQNDLDLTVVVTAGSTSAAPLAAPGSVTTLYGGGRHASSTIDNVEKVVVRSDVASAARHGLNGSIVVHVTASRIRAASPRGAVGQSFALVITTGMDDEDPACSTDVCGKGVETLQVSGPVARAASVMTTGRWQVKDHVSRGPRGFNHRPLAAL